MVRKPSTSYCIHCDLVDQHQNLLNEKPSNLLAKFDIKGIPFEKVYYEAGKHVLRDASSGEYVNSVTLSVKDLDGELFSIQQNATRVRTGNQLKKKMLII